MVSGDKCPTWINSYDVSIGTMSRSYFEIKRNKLLFTINCDKMALTIKKEKMNEKEVSDKIPL